MSNTKRNNGKFSKSAKYVECKCLYCNLTFSIKESLLKYGRGKYHNRKCCDLHKKQLQLGKNNGMYGKKESEEHKKFRGQKIKEGTTKESLIKRKRSIEKFIKNNGYFPGTDELSKKKRKETWLKKYGVDNPWKIKEIRDKCDKTCIELYGKNCWDLFVDSALYGHDTKIEKRVHNILDKLNISYTPHMSLPYNNSYREYDISIPSLKLLIEIDGDFWHANPELFGGTKSILYEIQTRNKENDILKNELAKKCGWNIVRFWENDINKDGFDIIFIDTLKKYGYDKN